MRVGEQDASTRPTSLARALRNGFRGAYDHLGYVVLTTFATFVAASALFSIGVLIVRSTRPGMGGIVLFFPAMFAAYLSAVGVFYYSGKVVHHEHPVPTDTFVGIKRLFRPALWLFAVDVVITLVLLADTMFFLGMFGAKGGAVMVALAVLCAYLVLVWLMMAMYHMPLLVAQMGMESGAGVRVILRKSFLLMADNPGFTLGLFLAIIALAVLCALPALIGMAVFYQGAAAFILTHALRELFIKYGIVHEEPESVDDNNWPHL